MSVIHSLYLNIHSCIRVDGLWSEYFNNNLGLIQGELLSPILFALYVNDNEMNFIEKGCMSFECKDVSLFLLMYADDLVLFCDTVHGLQHMLGSLLDYSVEW